MKRFDSGALSSEAAPRYDLIPPAALLRLAARMALGASTHGARNYQKGAHDPEFIRDRINHLLGHAVAYAAGDTSDDHLGAVLANAGMLADLEALQMLESGTHVPEREISAPFINNEQVIIPNGNTADPEDCSCASCQRG